MKNSFTTFLKGKKKEKNALFQTSFQNIGIYCKS